MKNLYKILASFAFCSLAFAAGPAPTQFLPDTLIIGSGTTTPAVKSYKFKYGLATEPSLSYDSTNLWFWLNKNNMKLGDGLASTKDLIFDIGNGSTNPRFRWDNGTATLRFSNDGTTYTAIGSGGGGGFGGVDSLELTSEGEKKGIYVSEQDNTIHESFATVQPLQTLWLMESYASPGTTITTLVNPLFLDSTNKNFDGATGWVATSGADAANIGTSATHKLGTNSLKWDKSGGSSINSMIEWPLTASLGVTSNSIIYYFMNLPSTTQLLNVKARASADVATTTNYKECSTTTQYDGSALASGWNIIKIDFSQACTTAGTGWTTSLPINSFGFGLTTTAAGQTYTGILIDSPAFNANNYLDVLQLGDEYDIADGTNHELVQPSVASSQSIGVVTIASALSNNYTAGTTLTLRRSLAVRYSNQVGGFDSTQTGNALKNQPFRKKKSLRATVTGGVFDVSVKEATSLIFKVSSVDSSVQIKVTDPADNSAEFVTGSKYLVFGATPSGQISPDFTWRTLEVTVDAPASASGGLTTIHNSGTNAGIQAGDYILKEDVDAYVSLVSAGTNETFGSALVRNDVKIDGLGSPYLYPTNLFAHYPLSGPTDLINHAGMGPDLQATGVITVGEMFALPSRFSISGMSSGAVTAHLTVAQSAPIKGDGTNPGVSLCIWLNPSTLPVGGNVVFDNGNGGGQGYQAILNVSGQVLMYFNGTNNFATGNAISADGNFHQFCAVLNGPGNTSTMYLDGIATNFTQPATDNTSTFLRLGVDASGITMFGSEAELMLWNAPVLTGQDVGLLFNAGKSRIWGNGSSVLHKFTSGSLTGSKLSVKANLNRTTNAVSPAIVSVQSAKQ